MTKHLLTYKVQWEIRSYSILRQIKHRTNDSLTIPKAEATFLLVEQIKGIYSDKEEKSPYINNVEKMDLISTAEYIQKADGEQINRESMHSTCTWSRSGIQSTQSGFKVIRFINNKRKQVEKPIRDEKFIAYLADTPVVLNDNGLLFKNNIEYTWAKFMQDSKITKGSMGIFFNNSDLAPIRKHLSYKSMDEMRALLIELPYNKVT